MLNSSMTPFSTFVPCSHPARSGWNDSPASLIDRAINWLFGGTSSDKHSIASEQSYDILNATASDNSLIESLLFALFENQKFDLIQSGEVVGYLQRYLGMYRPMIVACHLIFKEFKDEGTFSLEVYHDPEGHDEYLMLAVRQYNYTDDLLDRIERVSDQVRSYLQGESGWLLITTDFQPVRI